MNALTLLTTGLTDWLVERTGPNENSRLIQGARLDVFATSMRVTKQIGANLQQLAEGLPLIATDVTQRVTDLVATGLVQRADTDAMLTDFGSAVLNRWSAASVVDDSDENELLRQVILVDEGVSQGPPVYRVARDFWAELTHLHPAEQWFASPQSLYLVSYLNASDSRGYNPWTLIRVTNANLLAVTDAQWSTWAATTTKPSGWAKTAGEKLLSTVESAASRYVGRVTFCMALEARRRAVSGDGLSSIRNWSVPYA